MGIRLQPTEADTQKAILDYLAAKRIPAWRMNRGSVTVPETATSKRRHIEYGVDGMADILASPNFVKDIAVDCGNGSFVHEKFVYRGWLWIEAKAPKGVQSDKQKSFEADVRSFGHEYIVVRSIDEVVHWLRRIP